MRRRRLTALLGITATVVGGTVALRVAADAVGADTVAPTASSVQIVPGSIDITRADGTATAILRIQDTAPAGVTPSGFDSGVLTLRHGGTALDPVDFSGDDRTSGTALDGTYDVSVDVPQTSAAGSYTTTLTLTDVSGASQTSTPGATLTVTRTADTAAPSLVGQVTADPATVDTTSGTTVVTWSAHVTDNVSGTASVSGELSNGEDLDFDKSGGTDLDGTWTAERTFTPQDASSVSLSSLTLTDLDTNHATRTTGLGGTVTVTHQNDTTAPVLGTITLDSTAVNASDGDRTVNATVAVTDDRSGVDSVSLAFTDADGDEVSGSSSDVASGSRTHGTFVVPVDVPFETPSGTYTLSDVSVVDLQGNTLEKCTDFCDTAPPPLSLHVTSTSDTTPPTVTGLSVGPNPVTDAYEEADVDGFLSATDATSGVQSGTVSLQHGGTTVQADLDEGAPATGTIHDGSFHFRVDGLTAGTWTVSSVMVTDQAGNTTTLNTAQLTALHVQTSITVNDLQTDGSAPLLTGLSLSPTSVDTRAGGKDVTLRISARDPDADHGTQPSGLSANSDTRVVYTPDSGSGELDFTLDSLVAGTNVNGTWSSTQTVSPFAASGAWHATEVDLYDGAGHEHQYLPGDLTAAGITVPTLTVTSTPDTTQPTLTGVTVPTSTVTAPADPDDGGPEVPIGLTFTDTGAGVDAADVTVTGPGGQMVTSPLTGVYQSDPPGTLTVPVVLPRFNSAGSWQVTGVHLYSDGPDHVYDVTSLGALARTFTVATPADTTPPSVTSVQVTPSPVDTSSARVDATVLVHVTDAGAGAEELSVDALSPHGTQHLTDDLTLIAGDGSDGYWQGTLRFPRYVDQGTWRLALSGSDYLGNEFDLTSAQLTAAGLTGTVAVSGPIDATAPLLTGLAVTPSSADTTTGDKTFTLTAHATDGESGVAGVTVTVTGPNGSTDQVGLTPTTAGTPANAVLTGTYTAEAYSATGAYTFGPVVVSDVYGNATTYTNAQLSAAGFATGLTLTGTPDVTAPTLSGVSLSGTSVDVSAGAQSVTATVSATDNASGVVSGTLTYSAGGHDVSASFDTDDRTGTATAATFTVQLTVPQYTAPGSYALTDLELFDRAGNVADYTASTLPASGIARTLTVADAHPDVTAPSVASIVATPSPLDVHAGAQTLTVDAHVTDAASGVLDGELDLVGPSGQTTYTRQFDRSDRVSGTAADGVYQVSVLFPANSETGTWHISAAYVTDTAGNSTGSGVAPTTLSVTGTPTVPAAPTEVTADAGNGTATVSWDAPYNGGSVITGYVVTPSKAGVPQTPVTVTGTATQATVTGLTNGTAYTFTVAAVNAKGTGPNSNASPAVTPNPTVPGAPATVSATAGNQSISVSWTAPTDNGGSAVTGYIVQTYLAGGSFVSTQSVGAAVTTTTVTGLTNGTSYQVVVHAVNSIGQGDGRAANAVTPTATPPTLPDAPTGAAATVSGTTATVTWTAPANDGHSPITHYVVTPFDGATAGTPVTVGAVLTAQLPGLAKGHTYTFRVAAQNAVGTGPASAPSAAVTVPTTVPAAPAAPGVTVSGTTATLTFAAPGDTGGVPVTGYVVVATSNGTAGAPVAVTGSPATITGLTKGRTYTFTVAAKNAVGTGAGSPPSAPVTIATTTPAPPTAVAATPASATSLSVTWQPPSDTGGAAVTGYEVVVKQGSTVVSDTTVAGPGSATVAGLSAGVQYTVTVAAINAVGHSQPSTAVTVTLPPAAPTIGTASVVGTTATVSFTPPSPAPGAVPITGYVVTPYVGSTAGTPVTVSSSPATLTGLTVGTTYTFTVSATNPGGTGPASGHSNAVTPTAALPGAPTAVVATVAGATATVHWTAPTDNGGAPITGYVVTRHAGTTATVVPTTGTGTSVTDGGLVYGTAYTYTVQATTAAGTGPASAASAAVVPRVGTKLVITSASVRVAYGSPAKIGAKLTRSDTGAPVGGVRVYLQYRTHGNGSYHNAATAVTASSGAVAFSFKPTFIADIRVLTTTGGAYVAAVSAARAVSLTRKVSIAVSHTSVKHGRTFRVSGTVGPRQSGKVVYLQRRSGSRWVNVTTAKQSAKGAYAITVHTSAKGTFTYRVYVTSDAVAAATASAAKSVRVT